MNRKPVVAGQFYARGREELRQEIKGLVCEGAAKQKAIGIVVPHAGYAYSGGVAAACFSRVKFPDSVIILGPNHTGSGAAFSIMTEGTWQTPLGDVEIDSLLAQELLNNSSYLKEDREAHRFEHSIEVELPFLQYFRPGLKIVPIVIASGKDKAYKEIGREIAGAIKRLNKQAVIIASSDMTHYEPQESAKHKDARAIEAILDLDADLLLQRVRELDITMCGLAPTVSLIAAARELGARGGELVKYQTSGDISGDYSSVVGYAGVVIC